MGLLSDGVRSGTSEVDDGNADEEEDSDESHTSVLQNSDSEGSEDGDGRLDSLGAFVDNLRGDRGGPDPETNSELAERTSKG